VQNQPWKCPDCRTWIAPDVKEHRCDGQGAGVSVTPYPPPVYVLPYWPHLSRCQACGVYFAGYHACWTLNPIPSITFGDTSGHYTGTATDGYVFAGPIASAG